VITLDLSDAVLTSERVARRLRSVANFMNYAKPLMKSIERRIEEGNRKGILAGLDKDGNPAPRLTYRPIGTPLKLTVAQRLGQGSRRKRGEFSGFGPAASGLNNNLTSAEYRRLGGKRLAPRDQFSRSITNFATGHYRLDETSWGAVGGWVDVVSNTGFHFLPVHFDGKPLGRNGPSKRYDLRGVRPDDKKLIGLDIYAWAKLTIRERWDNPSHEYLGDL